MAVGTGNNAEIGVGTEIGVCADIDASAGDEAGADIGAVDGVGVGIGVGASARFLFSRPTAIRFYESRGTAVIVEGVISSTSLISFPLCFLYPSI